MIGNTRGQKMMVGIVRRGELQRLCWIIWISAALLPILTLLSCRLDLANAAPLPQTDECQTDAICGYGMYCFRNTGICVRCFPCGRYRLDSGNLNCPKTKGECGGCLSGFIADSEGFCWAGQTSATTTDAPFDTVSAGLNWLWFLVIPIVFFAIFISYKFLMKINNKRNTLSSLQQSPETEAEAFIQPSANAVNSSDNRQNKPSAPPAEELINESVAAENYQLYNSTHNQYSFQENIPPTVNCSASAKFNHNNAVVQQCEMQKVDAFSPGKFPGNWIHQIQQPQPPVQNLDTEGDQVVPQVDEVVNQDAVMPVSPSVSGQIEQEPENMDTDNFPTIEETILTHSASVEGTIQSIPLPPLILTPANNNEPQNTTIMIRRDLIHYAQQSESATGQNQDGLQVDLESEDAEMAPSGSIFQIPNQVELQPKPEIGTLPPTTGKTVPNDSFNGTEFEATALPLPLGLRKISTSPTSLDLQSHSSSGLTSWNNSEAEIVDVPGDFGLSTASPSALTEQVPSSEKSKAKHLKKFESEFNSRPGSDSDSDQLMPNPNSSAPENKNMSLQIHKMEEMIELREI